MNKRLLEEGINEIIMFFDEKISKTLTRKKAKIDFISLRASRYEEHSDYNPHYECIIDKVTSQFLELSLFSEYILMVLLLIFLNLLNIYKLYKK